MDTYKTILSEQQAEIKVSGSRFLAFIYPVHNELEMKTRIHDLKERFPKATHICYAYRLEKDGSVFRVNDDGEPSGSAGRPILGQMDRKELTYTLAAVVRYFGGTKLGIPGLIAAYKEATLQALDKCQVVEKKICKTYKIHFPYSIIGELEYALKQMESEIRNKEFTEHCEWEIDIPVKNEKLFLALNENFVELVIQDESTD